MTQTKIYYFFGIAPLLYVIYMIYLDILEQMPRMALSPIEASNGNRWITGAIEMILVLILTFVIFNIIRKSASSRARLMFYAILLGVLSAATLFLTGPDLGVISLAIAVPIWLVLLSVIAPLKAAGQIPVTASAS